MNPLDSDAVWFAFNLVVIVFCLSALVFGVRLAVTRRVPRLMVRFGVSAEQSPPPQFARFGGCVAFFATSLLIQQAAFLLPLQRPVGIALSGTALVVILAGIGWLAVRRD
jgi:hypothetical protein